MKPRQNDVIIRAHAPWLGHGNYTIEVRQRWFWCFYHWVEVKRFLPSCGSWNPLLLKHKEAVEFARQAKNQEFLDAFNAQEAEIARAHSELADKKRGEMYPVSSQKF